MPKSATLGGSFMLHRFYLEQPVAGDEMVLEGTEAHHLIRVLRAEVGDEVLLFDGLGTEYQARIQGRQRDRAHLQIVARRMCPRVAARQVHLGVAPPKGDRQKWLVEKATELGVTRLVLLDTERSVAESTPRALDRLRRTVIEACKQSGRNRLLELEAAPLAEFLAAAPGERWLADPSGYPDWARRGDPPPPVVSLAIGPEGGFTEGELQQAQQLSWQRISLGPRLLRIETAAVALAAYWLL